MLKWEQTRASAKTEILVNKLKPYDIFKKKKNLWLYFRKMNICHPQGFNFLIYIIINHFTYLA